MAQQRYVPYQMTHPRNPAVRQIAGIPTNTFVPVDVSNSTTQSSPLTATSSPYSPHYVIRNPVARNPSRTSTLASGDELGLPSLDRIPSINVAVGTCRPGRRRISSPVTGLATKQPSVYLAGSSLGTYRGARHLPQSAVIESVMHADKPILLCKILSFLSCHDKANVAMIICKSWKLCVFNPFSYSVVKLDFARTSDCLVCCLLSPMWFRLKLLVITNPGAADPTVLLALLKHVQSIRAIWLKCAGRGVSALDETFTISLLHVVGRSCEVIRLDRTFSVSIGVALSESCKNLRQLILSSWTSDASLLGDVSTLGLGGRGMTGLTSAAVGVENGTALHPLLLLLKEVGGTNAFLERLMIQFGDDIDKFAKGMPVVRDDGTVYDAWEVFERVFIDRLSAIAIHISSAAVAASVRDVHTSKRLKVTISFREHCVNILAFAHRVRSSIPDRIINVRIQKTTHRDN